jgi:hypothetical protein
MAPVKVLHGATREQGLASSPVLETQVRVTVWADAGVAPSVVAAATAARINQRDGLIGLLLLSRVNAWE